MSETIRIPFEDLAGEFRRVLEETGMEASRARECSGIFAENTRDGVASHGINRFPSFVRDIRDGIVDIRAEARRTGGFGMVEHWDGGRGIGPLNARKAMARAVELAGEAGMGCVGLGNTNHWMRAGAYGLQAAEAGFIGICWTNTTALMPPWGSGERRLGNNPLVICIPRREGPVLLDMAMSQFSFGRMEMARRRGESLPQEGGYDREGRLTRDPGAILESLRPLPAGGWKGAGLALMLDLLAALISGGLSTGEVARHSRETGVSQVFLAVNPSALGTGDRIEETVEGILRDYLSAPPLRAGEPVRFPGQNLPRLREEALRLGIPVDRPLWEEIRTL